MNGPVKHVTIGAVIVCLIAVGSAAGGWKAIGLPGFVTTDDLKEVETDIEHIKGFAAGTRYIVLEYQLFQVEKELKSLKREREGYIRERETVPDWLDDDILDYERQKRELERAIRKLEGFS